MQRRWKLSPEPTVTSNYTPSRGPERSLVRIAGTPYIRHRRSLRKVSEWIAGTIEGMQKRQRRVQLVRRVLIALCLVSSVVVAWLSVTR